MIDRIGRSLYIPAIIILAVTGIVFFGIAPLDIVDNDQSDSISDNPTATAEELEQPESIPVLSTSEGDLDNPADLSERSTEDEVTDSETKQAQEEITINSAERTIEDVELAHGESTTVIVDVELSTQGAPAIFEAFDPAFADVEIVSNDPSPVISEVTEANDELFSLWDGTETAIIEYEVTIPEDAEGGDIFTVTGEAETGDETVPIEGDNQIEVVGAHFEVDIVETNSPINEGETLEVTADIENTGKLEGTQDIELDIEELGTDSETVTLAGNESTSVTLSVGTEAGDAGEYTATVSSDDDSDSRTVEVTVREVPDPAFFDVEIVDTNDPVEEGEMLEVTADIENTGEERAQQEITLAFEDEIVDTTSITLSEGESETVVLSYQTEESDAGERSVTVASADESDSVTVTITELDVEPVYWQVDFGEGEEPPIPPQYWPDDGFWGLGNSEDGVTQNPSGFRMKTDGQLGDVNVIDNEFKFDDEDNPTEVTIEFEVADDGDARDLHLAAFTLPGPFDLDEIDQQELFEATSETFEGGDTGELTISIPQEDDK